MGQWPGAIEKFLLRGTINSTLDCWRVELSGNLYEGSMLSRIQDYVCKRAEFHFFIPGKLRTWSDHPIPNTQEDVSDPPLYLGLDYDQRIEILNDQGIAFPSNGEEEGVATEEAVGEQDADENFESGAGTEGADRDLENGTTGGISYEELTISDWKGFQMLMDLFEQGERRPGGMDEIYTQFFDTSWSGALGSELLS